MANVDVMDEPWCCLGCSSKFTFGQCVTKRGSSDIHCPKCGSVNLHPIDGKPHEVREYVGPVGLLN